MKPLPPDPDNDRRSDWADAAIREFMDRTSTDECDALADLLTDLMHWSDRSAYDFEEELARARRNYVSETTEDV